MPCIEVEKGVRIIVQDLDPGMGRPVLFLHGWPVNHKMFEYQFDQLPKCGFRCIGMDLRGFGNSDKPWCGYDYDRSVFNRAVMNLVPAPVPPPGRGGVSWPTITILSSG